MDKIPRREAIGLLTTAGAGLAFGCGSSSTPTSASQASAGATPGGASSACAVTPTETLGPFPSLTDLFRSDVREDRAGTPMTLTLTVVNTNAGCAPAPGLNVEIWQCDAAGNYSQYGTERSETYLRGIQTTNANGQVTFTTVYPGWYQGRATHIHIEVVRNGTSVKATQIAFPDSTNAAVYATGVYAARGNNPTTNARDGILADSLSSELATVSGDPTGVMSATFQLGVAV